ncbi:MAG: type I-C CRISPR-associated protein Cas5 [Ammonifex sp.]|jgi:CRISPR-associated protein Cas5d|nr:MAG: type I-C CRISPR-associated protein Cas5 [Ammonifex sp.]
MSGGPPLEVKVWGPFACFTRPEMKVERVSYPVMTPSAARGVLEAILWKPEFSWQVREIWVLNEIRHFSILRNEVNAKAAVSSAKGWAVRGGGYYADEDRAQRHTLALRDVAYLIKADIVLKPHTGGEVAKYRDMFRRRVNRGQCHHRPYLGCREFSAHFGCPDGSERPVEIMDDLGRMLFDMDFTSDESGRGNPIFFSARLEHGILRVPPNLYRRKEG